METASVPERLPLTVSPVGIAGVLLGLVLVSWIVTFDCEDSANQAPAKVGWISFPYGH